MLNKKQRINLRSFAMTMQDGVLVGKDGVTENVISQVNDNLNAHDIVKIKVLSNCDIDIKDIAESLVYQTKCEIVTVIGSKIVAYRKSDRPTNSKNEKVREALNK